MSITAQLDPDQLAERVGTLIERRQFGAVTKLIPAVAALAPERPLAALLAARLAVAEDRSADAAASLDEALATWPASGALLRLRAAIALAAGDPARAALAAADAVIADQADTEAKSLLGRAMLKLGRKADARRCLQEAVAANPQDVSGILALAEASPEQAALVLATAAARLPHIPSLHTSLLRILVDGNEPTAALDASERALHASALDVTGHLLAGHAAAMTEDWERARTLWREVLRRAPRHPSAVYRLAAERARGNDRLDPAIIAAADDARSGLAELVAMAGGTILPGRARAAFSAAGITGPVLDLGCGTGLCAIAARDLPVSTWDGVEASPRLAAIARERQLYRNLIKADPLEFLSGKSPQWRGISFNFAAGLAADLSGFFLGLASCLLPSGIAIGAIVGAPERDRFGPFCCFEHTEARIYAAAHAAKLSVKLGEIEPLMTVDDLALRGRIVMLTAS